MSFDRMRKALAFIEDHLSEPIKLKDIADAAALSPFHFARAFKKASGITPMRYVLLCRVDASKKLLANDDTQHATIVYECGFASESHFCTAFKSVTGMTTTAWRKLTTKTTAAIAVTASVFDASLLMAACP